MSDCLKNNNFIAHFHYPSKCCTYSTVWLLHGRCHVKLLAFRRVLCTSYSHASFHVTSCKATCVFSCNLPAKLWQNDPDLLRANAVSFCFSLNLSFSLCVLLSLCQSLSLSLCCVISLALTFSLSLSFSFLSVSVCVFLSLSVFLCLSLSLLSPLCLTLSP